MLVPCSPVGKMSAEAIRRAFDERGELAAVVERRRLLPGIVDNEQAALCARTIASWGRAASTKAPEMPRTSPLSTP